MSGFKISQPGLRFAAEKISPDEIDRYEVVTIQPGTQNSWFFLGTSGTADTPALVLAQRLADWPRNLLFSITGSSVGQAGSLDVNGRDQFGSPISETIGFGSADNGGTTSGTKVFRQVDSGTIRYGTFAGANGTSRLGFDVAGTATLLGLPVKIGGTTDVVSIAVKNMTTAIGSSVNGGTIAAFVNVPMHAIKSPTPLNGTQAIVAWVKTTFDATSGAGIATMAGGTQIT